MYITIYNLCQLYWCVCYNWFCIWYSLYSYVLIYLDGVWIGSQTGLYFTNSSQILHQMHFTNASIVSLSRKLVKEHAAEVAVGTQQELYTFTEGKLDPMEISTTNHTFSSRIYSVYSSLHCARNDRL